MKTHNFINLCKPISFQSGGDRSAPADPWSIWPLRFLIYHLLYNFAMQSFSFSIFWPAFLSTQEGVLLFGFLTVLHWFTSHLPHIYFSKNKNILSDTESSVNSPVVPWAWPWGFHDTSLSLPTPSGLSIPQAPCERSRIVHWMQWPLKKLAKVVPLP